uniref:G-protein coupled receptors family 1 profile domain-containing protein n=1 Tax=Panagrolaimus sp. PS1159 TaxID=55785 RepID=A0AC35GPB1_9BILA
MMVVGEMQDIPSRASLGLYLWYGLIICIGGFMNVYVLYRTKRLHRRDPEQFRNGIGICLCIMATADLVALMALLMHFLFMACNDMLSPIMQDLFCKFMMFATHTAYTQSMWCWFFMSALRYLATQHPLQYTTLWRLPYLALSISFIGAMIENAWLLVVVFGNNNECVLTSTAPTRVYWAFHVLISFIIPSFFVFHMDCSVLCCSMSKKYADPMLQIVINRPCGERKKLVGRFLMITLSCLVLNLPENLIRLATAAGYNLTDENKIPYWILQLSQTFYFSQFAFNAFYLTTFVYERSLMSKTNSSRQLSISFRQRLEESSHLLRERANTYTRGDVAYRGTTSPLPPMLVRNSSCCALDRLGPQKHWL